MSPAANGTMELRIVTPGSVVLEATASKVSAEAYDGAFTLLPRHVDLATALVPGLLSYVDADGVERLLAVDGGILVKRGRAVRLATAEAVAAESVSGLQRAMRESFRERGESERRSRAAMAHLETDAIRRLIEMELHD
jgi:F-type H+-transporting ATPase subunit epsilon